VSATDSITTVDGFNLEIAAGEIFGLAGVAGNGQSVLADAIAGAIALTEGEVSLDGEVLNRPGRRPRPDARVGYIPEQPLENAVAGDLDLIANMALTRVASLPFWLPRREEAAQTAVLMEKFDVRPRDPKRLARQLSGGNLQKLVIARELGKPCALVIACYPTMGLDIAASQAIREQLFRQAEAGAAVLWISEELDELLEHAHRVGVLFRGRLAGVTDTVTADRNEIGRWMGTGQ
jgi:simple sugar transport system ATP-binding protein